MFAFHVHKRVTGRREGRDDDHEARGRHKKVNSQTVQLVNPTGSDPDDHVNEEEEVRINLFSISLFFCSRVISRGGQVLWSNFVFFVISSTSKILVVD